MIEKGDKVKGIFSGKYLGIVVRKFKDQIVISGPDNAVFTMSALLVEPVPQVIAEGKPRIWAGV